MGVTHPHRIHGIGIFTHGFHVGQYPIPMDPMGSVPGSSILQATRGSLVFRASNWTLRSSFSWKFFSRRDGWIPMKKSQEMRRDVYVCIYIYKYKYCICICIYILFFEIHGMICWCLLPTAPSKKTAKFQKGELLSGSPDLFVLPGGVITMVQDANCCCIVQLQPEKVQFWRNLHVALGWKWWGVQYAYILMSKCM